MNIAEATISPISRDRLRDLRAALDDVREPAPRDSLLVSIFSALSWERGSDAAGLALLPRPAAIYRRSS